MITTKRMLLYLLLSLSLCTSAQEIAADRLHPRDGKQYLNNGSIPFTGLCITYYDNGIIHTRTAYLNGERHGLSQTWYATGDKMREITYGSFIHEGAFVNQKSIEWDPNGQIKSQYLLKSGLPHGKWIIYDTSSNILKQGVYRDGRHISGDKIEKTENMRSSHKSTR